MPLHVQSVMWPVRLKRCPDEARYVVRISTSTSFIVSAGRRTGAVKLRAAEDRAVLMESLAAAAVEHCPAVLQRVLLACDMELPPWPGGVPVSRIPSWEAAFREMRAKA